MRARPSSRLLILDARGRLLLFRFAHKSGPLAGTQFWATPGGALDAGESYEDAAMRELFEETGLRLERAPAQVARREAVFRGTDGEEVFADERYFLVRVEALAILDQGWTEEERAVMVEHRWWSVQELRQTTEQVWPEDVAEMVTRVSGLA